MGKRAELMCHTKMDPYFGLCTADELIRKAKKLSLSAVAITDADSPEAFPEAYYRWDRIKKEFPEDDVPELIYGMKTLIWDDEGFVVRNKSEKNLDTEYVVFDFETTGSSPVTDRIIEIGAVRIKDGKIKDSFYSLVNPFMHIPKNVTALTGIDDEKVSKEEGIETVLPKFASFCKGAVLADYSCNYYSDFLDINLGRLGINTEYPAVSIRHIAYMLLTELDDVFTLEHVMKELHIPFKPSAGIMDDVESEAKILLSLISMLKDKGINTFSDLSDAVKGNMEVLPFVGAFPVVILAKDKDGLHNMYRLISEAHTVYSKGVWCYPLSSLKKYRKGLLIGSDGLFGEVFRALLLNRSKKELSRILGLYDFAIVEPINNYIYDNHSSEKNDVSQILFEEITKKAYFFGKENSLPLIASSDVHYVDKKDLDAFKARRYLKNYGDSNGWKSKHHLMTDKELKAEFSFLGDKGAEEIVVENPYKLVKDIKTFNPVNSEKCLPEYPCAYEKMKKICEKRAKQIYGEKLPDEVRKRLHEELSGIHKSGFESLFMISYEITKKASDDGVITGTRGSSASSLVSYLLGISKINPLPAHYYCPKCHFSDFLTGKAPGFKMGNAGAELPDRKCPVCKERLLTDGYDIPVEPFLSLHYDKEPDFDFNMPYGYTDEIKNSVRDIDGIGEIYAKTYILTRDNAKEDVKVWMKDLGLKYSKEKVNEIVERLDGTCICGGLSSGGIVLVPEGKDINLITPVSQDEGEAIGTTFLQYFSLDRALSVINIYGQAGTEILTKLWKETGIDPRTVKMRDEKMMSLIYSPEAISVKPEQIGGISTGTLGVDMFDGYKYGGRERVSDAIKEISPENVSDLIRAFSLIHSTGAWEGNAKDLIKYDKKPLYECISTREDVMMYLMKNGLNKEKAFNIMEYVRKGRAKRSGFTDEMLEDLKIADVPEWYIKSCEKIWYLFPKAHCAEYAVMSWQILYYKLYHPEAFYRCWLDVYAHKDTLKYISLGYEAAKAKYAELKAKQRLGKNQEMLFLELPVVMEMFARGIDL